MSNALDIANNVHNVGLMIPLSIRDTCDKDISASFASHSCEHCLLSLSSLRCCPKRAKYSSSFTLIMSAKKAGTIIVYISIYAFCRFKLFNNNKYNNF